MRIPRALGEIDVIRTGLLLHVWLDGIYLTTVLVSIEDRRRMAADRRARRRRRRRVGGVGRIVVANPDHSHSLAAHTGRED